MPRVSEKFGFQLWLARQYDHRGNRGEVARAVGAGRVFVGRTYEGAIGQELAAARAEYDRLRKDGVISLLPNGSVRTYQGSKAASRSTSAPPPRCHTTAVR